MRFLVLSTLIAAFAAPALAQTGEAPVPPPRPAHLESAEPSHPIAEDRPALPLTTEPQPVTLSARLAEDGPFIPEGLVWRVFDTRIDESGELALLAKSEDATALFELPPGRYITHVAYGRAQTSATLDVEPGPNTRTLILEVGGLELGAVIAGDVPIPPDLLHFDITTSAPGGQLTVAENVPPGEILHLNAGIYGIVSRFGPINAAVRAELRVEPGQVTQATLYHHAAQVHLRLVSEEGGEAIADVDWTVTNPGGDTLFTETGAFPETVLAEGEYRVEARLGENVFTRDFSIQSGPPRQVEVLTNL